MGDDGLDGALGEGALSGFELQFEPQWMDRCPTEGQLTFRFARQDTAGQQAAIGRLSHVVAPCDARATAHLFGQFAHRMEEVHRVARQLVDSLQGRQRWRFEALVTHQPTHHRPVLFTGHHRGAMARLTR
jgi:hypothetical protein